MKQAKFSLAKRLTKSWYRKDPSQTRHLNWRRDPLSHPDIRAMSERDRADLQFNPHCVKPE